MDFLHIVMPIVIGGAIGYKLHRYKNVVSSAQSGIYRET